MGRFKPKRAARDQHKQRTRQVPRQLEAERYSSVGQAIKDGTFRTRTDAAQTTVGFLAETYTGLQHRDPKSPACGGPLLVHADGSFQCTAGCPGGTKVVHVPEALHFCDYADRLGIRADELGHTCPSCTAVGAADQPGMFSSCTGTEIDHQDGTTTCTLGDGCVGEDVMHASGQSCGLLAPCERCGIATPLVS